MVGLSEATDQHVRLITRGGVRLLEARKSPSDDWKVYDIGDRPIEQTYQQLRYVIARTISDVRNGTKMPACEG